MWDGTLVPLQGKGCSYHCLYIMMMLATSRREAPTEDLI